MTKQNIKGPFSKVTFEPLNINSPQQVKDYLKTIGWVPTSWNYKKNERGKLVRTSPKLTEDSYDSLPEGLGQYIAEYNVLKHRRNSIQNKVDPEGKGYLSMVREDGRIPAGAITCGTPTSRYKHKGICNIPGCEAIFGKQMRELFTVPRTSWLVGVDLSGIEARMLVHYCYPYTGGPEFAAIVLEGDFHSNNAKVWNVSRREAKGILYAMMYGAGDSKLGAMAGGGSSLGKKIKAAFMRAYPAYAALVEEITRLYKLRKYIRAIDGRKIRIRQEYRLLNSLIQSSSAVIFKHWMVRCSENIKDYKQLVAYHDELQVEVKGSREEAEAVGKEMILEIDKTGKDFNLNVKITGEANVGKNWAETH